MPRTTIDINVFNLPRLEQELERQEAQIVQLTQERDFWENGYRRGHRLHRRSGPTAMTNRELIELLQREPPDDEVAIAYEGVYTTVVELTETKLTDGTRITLIEGT